MSIRSTHLHPEAFCLMLYRDTAGTDEWLWNSRDGVTPFGIVSLAGLEAQHVEWHRDRYNPFYVPSIGSRIFTNMTMQRAQQIANQQVDRGIERGVPLPDGYTRDRLVEEVVPSIFSDGCQPDVVMVNEAIHKEFVERAKAMDAAGYPRPVYRPRKYA